MEFALKAHFPDDRGQTFPAVGIPYTALTAQGGVEGRLDGSGEVIIPDTGIAAVTIETLPDIDREIIELREAIRKELDAQHYSKIIEGGTEALLGVILTVITAGAGGAAAAGAAGSRSATVAAKPAPMIEKLSNAIKKRNWFKKRVTVKSNVREEVTTVHKPYSRHRPSYRKGQGEQVWENAKKKNKNGKVYNPDTKEKLTQNF